MTPLGPAGRLGRRQGPDDGVPMVFVADEQRAPGPAAGDLAVWQRLAEAVLADVGIHGGAELSVLFVDEDHIAELNRTFRGVVGPTDVLSFPIDLDGQPGGRWPDGASAGPSRGPGDPDDLPLLLGDIVICPAVANRNAPTHAGDPPAELALLLVHGILHLLGHDHADAADRDRMQAAERDLLARHWGPLPADPWAAVNAAADLDPEQP